MDEPEPTTPEPTPIPEPTTPEPVTSWMDTAGLDTDLKSNPTITKFKDVPSLAKSYLELQRTLGMDKIPLPGKDARPEEWDAVYNRLGRPDTVDGYELSDWKPPDGVPWHPPEVQAAMIEKMHGRRLTKEQARGVMDDYAELQAMQHAATVEAAEQANAETLTELKSKYGAALPVKMEDGKRAALAIIEKVGLSENPFETVLPDGRRIGDLPGMVEVMMAFGEAMKEDGSPGPGARTTRTPAEAQKELNEMLGDPKRMGILTDAMHPEHKALQERKADLERQIYG